MVPATPGFGFGVCGWSRLESGLGLRLPYAAVGLLSIQLSPQPEPTVDRGRNTTPLSHLADVPVLLSSASPPLPPSFVSPSVSISNSCPMNGAAGSVYVCVVAKIGRLLCVCVHVKERGREAGKRREIRRKAAPERETEKNRKRVTDGEKLCLVLEYNQLSCEPSFPSAPLQQHTSIVFACEGKGGNEAFTHSGPKQQTLKHTYMSSNHR